MRIETQPRSTLMVCAFCARELLILVVCLAIVAIVLLPGFIKSKARSSRLSCVNHMKIIGLAFRTWSLDNNDRFPMQVSVTNGGSMESVASGNVYPHFQVMSNELSTPRILVCPEDKKRNYGTNFALDFKDRNLSYFVNMDAKEEGASLLSGDRNITNRAFGAYPLVPLKNGDSIAWTREIHCEAGYLGFGDGSVYSFRNGKGGSAIRIGSEITNWLAVPKP